MIQRIREYLHERRMEAMRRKLERAATTRDRVELSRLWDEFKALHDKRAPAAVARLERSKGLR